MQICDLGRKKSQFSQLTFLDVKQLYFATGRYCHVLNNYAIISYIPHHEYSIPHRAMKS